MKHVITQTVAGPRVQRHGAGGSSVCDVVRPWGWGAEEPGEGLRPERGRIVDLGGKTYGEGRSRRREQRGEREVCWGHGPSLVGCSGEEGEAV